MNELKILVVNGQEYRIVDENAVRCDPQNLEEWQRAQARENIGAVSAEVIGSIAIELDTIINVQEEFIGGGVS